MEINEVGEVRTMNEASAAVARVVPMEVPLGDGRVAVVHEADWLTWEALWGEIQDLVGVGVKGWNAFANQLEAKEIFKDTTSVPVAGVRLKKTAEGDEFQDLNGETYSAITQATQALVFQAQGEFGGVVDLVMKKCTNIPRLVRMVIKGCVKVDDVKVTDEILNTLPGPKVLKIFEAALYHNFVANQEVADFFGGVLQLLKQSGLKLQPAKREPGTGGESQDS